MQMPRSSRLSQKFFGWNVIHILFYIRFTPKETDRLFRQLVDTNIADRPQGIQHDDILQTLLQVREMPGKLF